MNVLVLGLGNILMDDDGAGVRIAQELAPVFSSKDEKLRIVDGGTLGLDLLPIIEWAEKLIIVDACDLEMDPGTVVRIEGEDIEPVFEKKLSPHQMGLKDLLITAELADSRPPHIVFFGIQTGSIEMNMTLTPPVAKNMQKLRSAVTSEVLESFPHLA